MAQNAEKVVASNIRDRNPAELISLRSAKVEELRKLRFKKALEGSQAVTIKSHEFQALRRDIAVLNTVLGEKDRGVTVEAKAPKAAKPKAEKKADAPKAEKKAAAPKKAKAEKTEKAPAKKAKAKKGEE
ncbi:MAG: 50S ribosomal protein L29 [Myxococcota bacterium]